jgi:hypothetical protein
MPEIWMYGSAVLYPIQRFTATLPVPPAATTVRDPLRQAS